MSKTRDVVLPGGDRVKVDRGVSNLVDLLNQAGFVTVASCSGLRKDHAEGADASWGYLLFGNLDDQRRKVVERAAKNCGMGVVKSRSHDYGLRVDVSVLRDGTPWSPMIDVKVRESLAGTRTGRRAESASLAYIEAHGGFPSDRDVLSMWSCFGGAIFIG